MIVIGKKKSNSGLILGSKMGSSGMYLGSKNNTSQNHKHLDGFSSEHAHAQRSDLERGHHIPKDGQMPFTHGLGSQRKQWQRKKNH